MATQVKVTANNDFLNKPLNQVIPSYNMGTVNVGGTPTVPTATKTDLNTFNQQMVQGNTTPTITTPTVPTNTTPTTDKLSPYYDQNVSYLSEAAKYAKEQADTVIPTEEEARANALKAMQAEIDATNTLYADKLRRAQTQGAGLLGQTGAIQARRGLLGSDFGTAQTQTVQAGNEENYRDIENEKLVKIYQIQTKAKEDATAAIAAKRAAKEAGLKDYVDYLSKEKALKDTALTGTVQDMLANSIDLKDFNDSEIENLAKSYGVSASRLKSTYSQALASQTAEANKLAAEQAKAGRMTLTEGQRVFQIDPTTGEYKQVAYSPKTYAPKAANTNTGNYTGPTGNNQFKNDIDFLFNTVRTGKNSATVKLLDSAYGSARNDTDRLSIIASNVALPAEVKNDVNKRIQSIGSIENALALIDNGTKTGLFNGLVEKGINKLGNTTDPELAKINQALVFAIQPYRNSVTGAAWGPQEEAEYQSLLGSTLDNPVFLKSKLENLKGLMKESNVRTIAGGISPLGTEQTISTLNSAFPTQTSTNSIPADDYNYERDLAEAQQAIAQGADPSVVSERFNSKYSGNTQF